MNAREALEAVLSQLGDEPAVYATGFLARTAQAVRMRPQDFYMIGSMGLVSSIAAGIAISKPKTKVVALDGDGALLMNLGGLPTIGALGLKNFVHVVIDNESYESTGGQRSYSARVRLDAVAKACGYRSTAFAKDPASLRRAVRAALRSTGPSFVLAKVTPDKAAPAPRIEATPEAMTKTFSESFK